MGQIPSRLNHFCLLALALLTFSAYGEVIPRRMAPACDQPAPRELYAHENLAAFPCDLGALKADTKIWLIGETHQFALLNPGLDADSQAQVKKMGKFWAQVNRGAAAGQVFVLNEGEEVSLDGKAVGPEFYAGQIGDHFASFGIDDGTAYVTGLLVIVYRRLQAAMFETLRPPGKQLDTAVEQLRYFVTWILQLEWYNPLAHRAWRSVPRPIVNDVQEKYAKRLDALSCDPEGYDKIEALTKDAGASDLLDMVGLIDKSVLAFAGRLNELEIKQVSVPLDLIANLLPRLSSAGDFEADFTRAEAAVSTWRETLMAANIAKIYCADLQTGKRLPLVARVGFRHRDALMARLKAMALKSGLDPKLLRTREPILTKKEGG